MMLRRDGVSRARKKGEGEVSEKRSPTARRLSTGERRVWTEEDGLKEDGTGTRAKLGSLRIARSPQVSVSQRLQTDSLPDGQGEAGRKWGNALERQA